MVIMSDMIVPFWCLPMITLGVDLVFILLLRMMLGRPPAYNCMMWWVAFVNDAAGYAHA